MVIRVMMLMVLLFVNNANAFFLDKQKTFIFVSTYRKSHVFNAT
ncbi:hypothetical protein [Orientia tsutsugamushi]|uniref:Type-F conjugative transfer system pilin assembly protein TrbC n=1 Tax=Orientia tsutsugamushi TaxID=784 RepID=A0A2U3RNR1_ORITS|nr:hypothetical protein [Orientia tsutsugamushi]SPR14820.1 type-F conjugative transfer system pilin assembly protein TrbC [Orientia tsutsugamushi]SPR16199.1 type-F conjugative transfer system pilin assembly protein TrbC [Orientia tsutsugamushi]